MTTIRMLIVLLASYNLDIHQMDIITIFLNGELKEEVYIEQYEGFVVFGQKEEFLYYLGLSKTTTETVA